MDPPVEAEEAGRERVVGMRKSKRGVLGRGILLGLGLVAAVPLQGCAAGAALGPVFQTLGAIAGPLLGGAGSALGAMGRVVGATGRGFTPSTSTPATARVPFAPAGSPGGAPLAAPPVGQAPVRVERGIPVSDRTPFSNPFSGGAPGG